MGDGLKRAITARRATNRHEQNGADSCSCGALWPCTKAKKPRAPKRAPKILKTKYSLRPGFKHVTGLFAFWRYDLFPYVFGGAVMAMDVNGAVQTESYGGWILPSRGKEKMVWFTNKPCISITKGYFPGTYV